MIRKHVIENFEEMVRQVSMSSTGLVKYFASVGRLFFVLQINMICYQVACGPKSFSASLGPTLFHQRFRPIISQHDHFQSHVCFIVATLPLVRNFLRCADFADRCTIVKKLMRTTIGGKTLGRTGRLPDVATDAGRNLLVAVLLRDIS